MAMPEAVTQMKEDMDQVVVRLAQTKVSEITQGMEEDIIEALEEMIAALQKAQKDLEEQKQPPGEPPPPGKQQDPPLIDLLAELKMLKSLQLRVNKRTARYNEIRATSDEDRDDPLGQVVEQDLLDLLDRLAEREERIFRATKDIATGRNK